MILKKSQITVLALILVVFIFSVTCAIVNNKGHRYTFVFPAADSDQLITENRYLPFKHSNIINLYTDELLLGAVTERTKNILPKGTYVKNCFLRNNVLYLDLSEEFINYSAGDYPLKDGVALMEMNIKANFPAVKSIELFVNSKKAYQY